MNIYQLIGDDMSFDFILEINQNQNKKILYRIGIHVSCFKQKYLFQFKLKSVHLTNQNGFSPTIVISFPCKRFSFERMLAKGRSKGNICWLLTKRYFSSQRLQNKVAVITGAASGIGRETTKLFHENGATVIAVDINKENLQKLENDFECETIYGDASNEDEIKSYVQTITNKYKSIDILVNNAGFVRHFGPFLNVTNKDFKDIMDINVMGVFWNCKYFIPYMLNNTTDIKGSIINVSSVAGLRAVNGIGPYVVAKHAVFGLTKQIGIEYISQGIRCNSVHPGWCDTPIINQITSVCKQNIGVEPHDLLKQIESTNPTKRFAKPSEIVPIILFLASDESSWCNAQPFTVDAGLTQYV
eukprot:334273_1